MLNRYSVLDETGFAREMVLLKSLPCKWGRCTFCDYIRDNSSDIDEINSVNCATLARVTGKPGILDVINSGSIFELPSLSMEELRRVVQIRGIRELFVESHWLYRNQFAAFRNSFDIPVRFRVGIESFDDDFRNQILGKGVYFKDIDELKTFCDSICLMVCIEGQSREMIERDIDLLTTSFTYGAVSVFSANSTRLKPDPDLIAWFWETYGMLDGYPTIDVLYSNLDYGVNA